MLKVKLNIFLLYSYIVNANTIMYNHKDVRRQDDKQEKRRWEYPEKTALVDSHNYFGLDVRPWRLYEAGSQKRKFKS